MVTMSAVWDRATEFLSDNIGPVAAIAGLTLFLPSVVENIFAPLQATAGSGGTLGLGLLSLAISLIGVLGQAALVALALEPALGRGGAFSRGLARLGSMIGVSLAILLGVVVLCLPPVLLLAIGGIDLSAMSEGVAPNISPGNALVVTLYMIVLVPVFFWIGARLTPLAGVVVAERRGLGAIKRSFELTRGLAPKLIGVIILFLVVAGVVVLAAKTVLGALTRLALGEQGPVDAASIVTGVVVALVSTVLTTVAIAFVAKLYLACVARAEVAPAA